MKSVRLNATFWEVEICERLPLVPLQSGNKLFTSPTKKNSRYYKYRVARSYKDYYDAFASKYEESDKDIFLKRCQEMYRSLLQYKKGLDRDEMRKDVQECESTLKYILDSENINF